MSHVSEAQLDVWARWIEQSIAMQIGDYEMLLAAIPAEYRQQVLDRVQLNLEPVLPVGPKGKRTRRDWQDSFDSSQGRHWLNLRSYLFDALGREASEVTQLDKASDKVLYLLGDPKERGSNLDKVKGLVVGYVQSGKTGNYTALIAKAYDAGYQNVIVLTGIHNSLRRQTQLRLDVELGLVESTEERISASKYGQLSGAESITRITNEELLHGDFRYSTIDSNLIAKGKSLSVTKKNVFVLTKLTEWLGNSALDVPTLIIDDEADQATVNTRGGVQKLEYESFEGDNPSDLDRDPTEINKLVRTLLLKFNNVSYVGYTATPYANVFIPFNETHSVIQDDLYPKDFILSLPKPKGYMGPEEFFGSAITGAEPDEESSKLIEIVPPEEAKRLENLPRAVEGSPDELPETLRKAIRQFLLAAAAKRTAEGKPDPSSMLIHASHLKDKQKQLAEHVEIFVNTLTESWRYFRESALGTWSQVWDDFLSEMDGVRYKFEFEAIVPALNELLGKYSRIPVLLLNYSSDDELDYERDPHLNAIIVGGNKLSRGLTLKGLLVSYFVRKTSAPKADTLTQMGRFFGYRRNVVDITRLYTTDELRDSFISISLVEESLRREIEDFERDGRLPKDYAIRVRRRAGLMPTSANKMRAAKAGGTSYSGDLVQTTSFPGFGELASKKLGHKPKTLANIEITSTFAQELLSKYGSPIAIGTKVPTSFGANVRAQVRWEGVSYKDVLSLLDSYSVVVGATRFISGSIRQYIKELAENPNGGQELTTWTVAIAGRIPDRTLGTESFGTSMEFGRVERSLVNGSDSSIGVLVSPLNIYERRGDELLDFSDSEYAELRAKMEATPNPQSWRALRDTRPCERGLLVIYPISPASKGQNQTESKRGKRSDISLGESLLNSDNQDLTIVGLALSFPSSKIDATRSEHFAQDFSAHQESEE